MANTKITSRVIAANAILTANITDANVTTAKIADSNVTVGKMAANSVDSNQYVDGSIDTAHIADSQITVGKMAANSVDSDQYVDGSIDLAHMSVNSIDSDQYVDGSIDLAHMSDNSIDSDQYVDGSIDTAHIADSQITVGKMAANSVDSAQYVDGSIDTAHYADNSITGAELADNIDIAGTLDVTGAAVLDSTLGVAGATTLGSSLAGNGAPFTISNTNNGNNIDIKTTSSNSLVHAIKIHSGGLFEAKQGAVFNEDGADVDFRVESNGSTHMFFVDAGANKILMSSNPASDTQSAPHDILTLSTAYADSGTNGVAGLGPRIVFRIPDDEDNPSTGGGIAVVKASADDSDSSSAMTFAITQNDETLDEAVRINSDASFVLKGGTAAALQHMKFNNGASSFDDDVVRTYEICNTGALIAVSSQKRSSGNIFASGLFYACTGIAGGADITTISDPASTFATTDTDGKVCIFKGNNSGIVSIKNRIGTATNISIAVIEMQGN